MLKRPKGCTGLFSFIVCWAFVLPLIPLPLIPDLIVGVFRCVITEGTLITKPAILSSALAFTAVAGYKSIKNMDVDAAAGQFHSLWQRLCRVNST